ncbi:MAG TPA: hypothetical protein VJU61_24100 [Polyangiaceae bacterium]|nr:hypothetical protein [Polyangiaceae bacterium]
MRSLQATGLCRAGGLLAAAIVLVVPALAAAEEATASVEAPATEAPRAPSALELSASLGPSFVFSEPANPAYTQSYGRVGVLAALAVAYRSPYFLDPTLEVGYASLAKGESLLPDGPWGEGGLVEQRLATWVISPGVSAELWRFRARLGIGIEVVSQSYTFRGEESSSSQFPISSQLVLGFKVLDNELLRLDAEGRMVVAQGAAVNFASLGLAARFDVISFGQP